jgi:hypothetical protein
MILSYADGLFLTRLAYIGFITFILRFGVGTNILIIIVIWGNIFHKSKDVSEEENNTLRKTTKKKIVLVYITGLVLWAEECIIIVVSKYASILSENVSLNKYILIYLCEMLVLAKVISIVLMKQNNKMHENNMKQIMTTKKKIAMVYMICLIEVLRSVYFEFVNYGEVLSRIVLYRASQYFIEGTIVLIVLIAFKVIKKETYGTLTC